jgi:two-component system OmpR family sensor kinase
MLNKLKIRLTFTFLLLVVSIQLLTSLLLLWYEWNSGNLNVERIGSTIVFLATEIFLMALVISVIGYYFTAMAIRPAEVAFVQAEQFMADASHELNTPLTLAMSNIELALKTQDYEKYLLRTKENVSFSFGLIRKMLQLAQIDVTEADFMPVDVKSIIDEAIQVFESKFKAKNLKIVFMSPEVEIKADNELLRQCIFNLLQNAIKFNVQGGEIVIDLRRNSLSIINSRDPQAKIELERIFDRFFRDNGTIMQEGFGIGLSIVKKVCDIHRWTIRPSVTDRQFKIQITF